MNQVATQISATQTPTTPGVGGIGLPHAAPVKLPDAIKVWTGEYTATAALDLGVVPPILGPGDESEFVSQYALLIEVIKTAVTTSGTAAIVAAAIGFASETINLGDAEYLAAGIGDTVWSVSRTAVKAKALTNGTDVGLTLTSPVGFKIRVSVVAV